MDALPFRPVPPADLAARLLFGAPSGRSAQLGAEAWRGDFWHVIAQAHRDVG